MAQLIKSHYWYFYNFLELSQAGLSHTPLAALSRPVAGVRGKTLIVTLPGSPKAVKENIEAFRYLKMLLQMRATI